jgi:hypothetical protein
VAHTPHSSLRQAEPEKFVLVIERFVLARIAQLAERTDGIGRSALFFLQIDTSLFLHSARRSMSRAQPSVVTC